MAIEFIFKLVYTMQIILLSYIFPRILIKKIRARPPGYILMNNIVASACISFLAMLSLYPIFESLPYLLLAIGITFIIQLLPLFIGLVLRNIEFKTNSNTQDSYSFFEAVHPSSFGLAIVLFFVYLVFAFTSWNKSINTQLLQITIYIGTNIFLAGVLSKNILNMKKIEESEDREKHIQNLYKITPLFVYISILISIYYFGKKMLIDFDLHQYRPIMMSLFLQLIGIIALIQLSRTSVKN